MNTDVEVQPLVDVKCGEIMNNIGSGVSGSLILALLFGWLVSSPPPLLVVLPPGESQTLSPWPDTFYSLSIIQHLLQLLLRTLSLSLVSLMKIVSGWVSSAQCRSKRTNWKPNWSNIFPDISYQGDTAPDTITLGRLKLDFDFHFPICNLTSVKLSPEYWLYQVLNWTLMDGRDKLPSNTHPHPLPSPVCINKLGC